MNLQKIYNLNKKLHELRIFTFDLYVSAIVRCGKVISYEYSRIKRDNNKFNIVKGNHRKYNFENLKTRFISFTTSYIITICNLEDIFIEFAKNIIELYTIVNIGKTIPREDEFNKKTNLLKSEIALYKFYRDKLYAHPAYIKPRGEREGMKDTLMHMYGEGPISFSSDGNFVLGGIGIAFSPKAVEENSNWDRPHEEMIKLFKDTIPEKLEFINDYKRLENHFNLWEQYCLDLLSLLYNSIINVKK